MTESELVLAEQKANDYGSVVNRLKQDMGDMAARHHDELRKEKEVMDAFVYVCGGGCGFRGSVCERVFEGWGDLSDILSGVVTQIM